MLNLPDLWTLPLVMLWAIWFWHKRWEKMAQVRVNHNWDFNNDLARIDQRLILIIETILEYLKNHVSTSICSMNWSERGLFLSKNREFWSKLKCFKKVSHQKTCSQSQNGSSNSSRCVKIRNQVNSNHGRN